MPLCFSKSVKALTVLYWNLETRLLDVLSIDLDSSPHNISCLDRSNSLRCSCQNDITSLQCHHPADSAQLSWNAVQHQLCAVRLLHLAIDREPEMCVLRVWDARLGNELRDGQESVEALGNGPREALLLCFFLYVAACHVDREEVTCRTARQLLFSHSCTSQNPPCIPIFPRFPVLFLIFHNLITDRKPIT